jgi:hypothetical protein
MTKFIGLLSLLATAPLFAATVIYSEPPAPTSATPIVLTMSSSMGGSCPVVSTTATVTGREISVNAILEKGGCDFQPVFFEYRFQAALGPIAAGVYEVTARLEGTEIGTSTLTVRQADPDFVVVPEVTFPGERVRITGVNFDCPDTPAACAVPQVRFGGVNATVVTIDSGTDSLVVEVPSVPQGPADVTVTAGATTETVPVAAYLAEDTRADRTFVEPVLFPVVYSAEGAFGSKWETALSLRNDNPYALTTYAQLFHDITSAAADIRPPAQSTILRRGPIYTFPTGVVEHIARQAMPRLSFGTVIRDRSRSQENLGTEVPVVRESDLFDQPFHLLNVPTDPRYRVGLRLYDVESGLVLPSEEALPRAMRVSFTSMENDNVITSLIVPLNKGSISFPAFAMIPDLVAAAPALAGQGPLRVQILPDVPSGQRTTWALISITNNETQQVTLISPQ